MTAQARLSAQLTLAWDGTTIRAEMPGENGSRQKIEEATFNDLPLWIKNRLIVEIEKQRDRNVATLRRLQNDNIRYVSQSHGRGVVAASVWHNGEFAFNRTWKKHLAGESGNLASANGQSRGTRLGTSAPRAQAKAIDNQTLDRLQVSRKDLKEGLDL